MLRLLRFVNSLAAGVEAGGQLFVLTSVLPAARSATPVDSARLHRDLLIEGPYRFIIPAHFISMFTAIATLPFLARNGRRSSIGLTLAGIASLGVITFISIRFEFPINRTVAGWPSDRVSEEYASLRRRWDTIHAFRTALGVTALGCFTLAALEEPPSH